MHAADEPQKPIRGPSRTSPIVASRWYEARAFRLATYGIVVAAAVVAITVALRGRAGQATAFAAFVAAAAVVVWWLRREPPFYLSVLSVSIIGNGASWVFEPVRQWAGTDNLLHALTSFGVGVVFAPLLWRDLLHHLRTRQRLLALAVVTFTLAVGAAWEIVEALLYAWVLPRPGETKANAVSDLVFDLLGALVAVLVLVAVTRRGGRLFREDAGRRKDTDAAT